MELTTDFVVGAPEDSLLIQRPGEPASRFDMPALRREHFVAQGVDPDREVWVYQYFAHLAFARALRDGTAPSPGFGDALLAHALVEAAYRSCASGLAEPLAPLLA